MNKQRISNILSSIQMNPKDRKNLVNELYKGSSGGDGITIVDSIDKLNPNAKVGSIASVATEKSIKLLNIPSLPIAEIDENWNYIFSDNLVKINELKINIIKQIVTSENVPAIELFDFNTSHNLTFVTFDGLIYFVHYHIDDYGNRNEYIYYDATTDTVNKEALKTISDILVKGNFYFINDCREDNCDKSIMDLMYNTFELYSISGDTDAELFIKKEVWEPLISNENDSENGDVNGDENDIPEFTLNFRTLNRVEMVSGSTSKLVGYDLIYDCIEESEVNFVEGKAKIKIYLETDLFRTVDPIIAEVTIGNKFGAMTYNFVNIDTSFNQIKVLYYNDNYEDYISGTLKAKYYAANLKYYYYLTISNEVLIDSFINTEDNIKTLLGMVGVNTRPCKLIINTYNNNGNCIVPGVINAEDINNVYINVIYNSNISKYKVNTNNIGFEKTIITDDTTMNVNVDSDNLDATISQQLYGRLNSSIVRNLYFILDGATYSVNSIAPSGKSNKWYVTFGSDVIYKYLIYCYPATASPITFKAQILERKSFDLNKLIEE